MDFTNFLSTILSTLTTLATTYLLKIILALLIIVIGGKLVKLSVQIINKSKAYDALDAAVKAFLNSFIKILGNAVVLISAATVLGVPATSFITVLASCGLAIGMALQGSLSNLAGGIMILIFKPFKIGDYIISGGNEGTVRDINILYTKLTTGDNKVVTIPNGALSNSAIVDVTANETRRVDINIGVSYNSDLKKAMEILKSIGDSCELALKDPAPVSMITGFADSSVNLSLRVWAKTGDYWATLFALNEAVKAQFDANGIEIPFPQMDVHIKN